MKDKSSLQAQLAGVQKDNQHLTRAQAILQAKASSSSSAEGKRSAELRAQLDSANHKWEDSQKVCCVDDSSKVAMAPAVIDIYIVYWFLLGCLSVGCATLLEPPRKADLSSCSLCL